jgi:hypothetical protein
MSRRRGDGCLAVVLLIIVLLLAAIYIVGDNPELVK